MADSDCEADPVSDAEAERVAAADQVADAVAVSDLEAVGSELASATEKTSDSVDGIVAAVESARDHVIYQSSSVTETSATIDGMIRNIRTLNE